MKVCILMGGYSKERDISIKSAEEIFKSINKQNYIVNVIDINCKSQNNWIKHLLDFSPDIVIISIHGELGEDGSIQGLLESMNIPFIGSKVMSSSLCINKSISKDIMKLNFIPVADYVILKNIEELDCKIYDIDKLGYPLVVKPNKGGSSIGVSIVYKKDLLKEAIQQVQLLKDDILIEKYIEGQEVTCCIIENNNKLELMTILDINPKSKFYDYNSKYVNEVSSIEDSKLPEFLKTMIQEISKKAFKVLGCSQYATVDMIVNEEQVIVIEVNTLPGLTSRSLMHKAAIKNFGGLGDFIDTLIRNRMSL